MARSPDSAPLISGQPAGRSQRRRKAATFLEQVDEKLNALQHSLEALTADVYWIGRAPTLCTLGGLCTWCGAWEPCEVPERKQVQVPRIAEVQKMVDVPQAEVAGPDAHVPEQKHHHVPKVAVAPKLVEMPQGDIVGKVVEIPVEKRVQVPEITEQQKIMDVPREEIMDEAIEAPVQKQVQVPMIFEDPKAETRYVSMKEICRILNCTPSGARSVDRMYVDGVRYELKPKKKRRKKTNRTIRSDDSSAQATDEVPNETAFHEDSLEIVDEEEEEIIDEVSDQKQIQVPKIVEQQKMVDAPRVEIADDNEDVPIQRQVQVPTMTDILSSAADKLRSNFQMATDLCQDRSQVCSVLVNTNSQIKELRETMLAMMSEVENDGKSPDEQATLQAIQDLQAALQVMAKARIDLIVKQQPML